MIGMGSTMRNSLIETEIRQTLEVLYRSLATSAQECGLVLPNPPPAAFYTASPLVQRLEALADRPHDPATSLRTLAAFLHQCPPQPTPLPLPDWFWHQIPHLAAMLLATGQWLTYPQAAQQIEVTYQQILDLARKGILLSLYAPRPNQSDRHCRYVWQPDVAAHFPDTQRGDPHRKIHAARSAPAKRSPI
jgi:hypothetical protein